MVFVKLLKKNGVVLSYVFKDPHGIVFGSYIKPKTNFVELEKSFEANYTGTGILLATAWQNDPTNETLQPGTPTNFLEALISPLEFQINSFSLRDPLKSSSTVTIKWKGSNFTEVKMIVTIRPAFYKPTAQWTANESTKTEQIQIGTVPLSDQEFWSQKNWGIAKPSATHLIFHVKTYEPELVAYLPTKKFDSASAQQPPIYLFIDSLQKIAMGWLDEPIKQNPVVHQRVIFLGTHTANQNGQPMITGIHWTMTSGQGGIFFAERDYDSDDNIV
jgi:hypothetical protein